MNGNIEWEVSRKEELVLKGKGIPQGKKSY